MPLDDILKENFKPEVDPYYPFHITTGYDDANIAPKSFAQSYQYNDYAFADSNGVFSCASSSHYQSGTPKKSKPATSTSPARHYTANSTVIGTPRRIPASSPILRTQPSTPASTSNTPRRASAFLTPSTPKRPAPIVQLPSRQKKKQPSMNNNNGSFMNFSHLSLNESSNSRTWNRTADTSLSQFERSMLSTEEYYAKNGRLNDAFKEREECSLIAEIVDGDLSAHKVFNALTAADPTDVLFFLKSHRGSHFIRDTMGANKMFCKKISSFIVNNKMVVSLAISQSGNFVVQQIPGNDHAIDKAICAQIVPHLWTLVSDKYGCRVMQTFIKEFDPNLVTQIVRGLEHYELKTCVNLCGTHVVLCLLNFHSPHTYESFFYPFTEANLLCQLMENKHGCRIIQKVLEALAHGITLMHVPPLLNSIVVRLLQDAQRYIVNEYANYVIQYIITDPAFKRQRDYIIDHFLLNNVLLLSQNKFSSHIIEAALSSDCQSRVARICDEIFSGYRVVEKSPLEILLFDNYGNYVAQKILHIAVEVAEGKRCGNPNWLGTFCNVVSRHRSRLNRYSSGKKILEVMGGLPHFRGKARV